jgi:hypothetical protein
MAAAMFQMIARSEHSNGLESPSQREPLQRLGAAAQAGFEEGRVQAVSVR